MCQKCVKKRIVLQVAFDTFPIVRRSQLNTFQPTRLAFVLNKLNPLYPNMDQNLFNQLRPFLDKSNLPLQPQLEPQLDQVLQDLLDKAANEHADKKPRTFFTEEEKFVYEAAYDEDPFFAQCPKNRAALALTFSRTERQIKKWFQNRRAIEKKEQEEEAVGQGLEDKVRKELHDS